MILTTTQIAARLGVSERTAQRGLNSGTIRAQQVARARYEIGEEEFKRISEERDPHGTELQQLREEVAVLSRRVSALETELADLRADPARTKSAPVANVARSGEDHPGVAASGELPDDLVSWRPFAAAHGMADTTVHRAIKAERLPVVLGEWKVGRAIIYNALDAAGRRAFYELYQSNPKFQPCADCPHDLEV